MIEQRVTLRYGAQQIPAIVQAVQGDTGRDVIFELADYEIPAGATANYYIDKPDDTAIYNSAEVISSTEILAHLTEQALAVPGRNNGQVRILSDGEVITSFDFVLEVEVFRGILRLQSETEVNIFDEALQAAAEDAIVEIQAQTPVVTGMQNSIAPTYSSSSTYAVGDYVMYNAQLYRCVTAITTAEAWTAAHWAQVPLANDLRNTSLQKSGIIVSDGELNGDLLAPYKTEEEAITYQINSDKIVMPNGTIADFGATSVTEKIILDEGALYKCRAMGVGGGGGLFAIYDINDELSATYKALDTSAKTFYFRASKQFKKIIFNILSANPTDFYLHKITLDDIKINSEFERLEDDIYNRFPYDDTQITMLVGKLLRSDGTVIDYGTSYWYVSDEIDISGNVAIKIKASTGYENLYYAFYDESHNCIQTGPSPMTGLNTFEGVVIIPSNAKYVRISNIGTNSYYVKTESSLDSRKKWIGKKWVCVGDSLTEANAATTKHYFDYVSDITGIEPANYGIGGTGYANPNGTLGNFAARMESVPTDADVYTIFGSFNDYAYITNNNIPIGNPSDSGTSTLCGYINAAFDALFARVPLANLGIVAPCPWSSVNPVTSLSVFGENYTEALRLCCLRRSIPFLDLYHDSGMRPWDSAFEELTYTKDALHGVHPDETGHAILAPKFEAFLDRLILH